ncbi:hypothetical protein OH76DRAFT_559415 [Lentinus brumalis]|uniref:Uncharacterized protein n=1 Tax=Lentinus brumalis TaxID=2498619 RepID=A0A371D9E2_9APHY|nr:hypothetical protein OH76DRAFT_559415 [Polyporus brumalis]
MHSAGVKEAFVVMSALSRTRSGPGRGHPSESVRFWVTGRDGLNATVDRREHAAEHAALTRPIITYHPRPSLACQVSLPAMPGLRPYRHLLDFQLVCWASKFRTISITCEPSEARTRRAGSTYVWREPASTWAAMCAPVSQKCTRTLRQDAY